MMRRFNFYISDIQMKRLESLSKKSGLTVSEILRRAIDEYWERFERKGRRSWLTLTHWFMVKGLVLAEMRSLVVVQYEDWF
jgi:hypothetical protein